MKKGLSILAISLLLVLMIGIAYFQQERISFSPSVAADCSQIEITNAWGNIFKENPQNIIIHTKEIESSCVGYVAYKLVGNHFYILSGSKTSFFSDIRIASASHAIINIHRVEEFEEYLQNYDPSDSEITVPLDFIAERSVADENEAKSIFSFYFKQEVEKLERKTHIIEGTEATAYIYTNGKGSTKVSEAQAIAILEDIAYEQTSSASLSIPFDICIIKIPALSFFCEEEVAPKKYSSSGGSCKEEWNCSGWGECRNGIRLQECRDENFCGSVNEKPAEIEFCGQEERCIPVWDCTDWAPSNCENTNIQERTCTDINNCGTQLNQPSQERFCESPQPPQKSTMSWGAIFAATIIILLILIIVFLVIKKQVKQ